MWEFGVRPLKTDPPQGTRPHIPAFFCFGSPKDWVMEESWVASFVVGEASKQIEHRDRQHDAVVRLLGALVDEQLRRLLYGTVAYKRERKMRADGDLPALPPVRPDEVGEGLDRPAKWTVECLVCEWTADLTGAPRDPSRLTCSICGQRRARVRKNGLYIWVL